MHCKDKAYLFLEPKAFSSHYSIHCSFILKLAKKENISILRDRAEVSKIGKLCFKHSLITVTLSDVFTDVIFLQVTSK